jgi:ABC-2 type transport system ATP-binding protein
VEKKTLNSRVSRGALARATAARHHAYEVPVTCNRFLFGGVRMELILEGIAKRFGDKEVLQNVSYRFEQGKIYGLLGRNGAGKTTLFNCLSGELKADGGTVTLAEGGGAPRPVREEDIGYVYSLPILPDFLTGYEFISFFMDVQRGKCRTDLSVDDYFDLMRIDKNDRHRLIKGYSHGMKNKLQMMLFLITQPPVILLDEPLTSFDVVVALEMKNLLREMKPNHILIFSTHILQLASDLCDELVVLHNGALSPVPSDMLRDPAFEQRIIDMLKDESHVGDV